MISYDILAQAVTNRTKDKTMATITCEVMIKMNGNLIETRPSTSKILAKQYGSRRAKKIGGSYEVKEVQPREYRPE